MTAEWVQAITAVLGFVLAVLLGMLAWFQYRPGQNRLRLDLFDRRWIVYKTPYDFISSLSQEPKSFHECYPTYLKTIHQTKFLFDSQAENYFTDVQNRALDRLAIELDPFLGYSQFRQRWRFGPHRRSVRR